MLITQTLKDKLPGLEEKGGYYRLPHLRSTGIHLFKDVDAACKLAFKENQDPIDLFVFSHTHRPFLERKNGTLWLNPGETCGWVFGNPTVALYDTEKNEAHIVSLDPPLADIPLSDILSRSPSS